MTEEIPKSLKRILVTDCGSTTTKALLFEKTREGWRQTFRGEAPTTVEYPHADVTIGARNAFQEIEAISNLKILKEDSQQIVPFIFTKADSGDQGIDVYLSTSSAGGGLQMVVSGLVKSITAESAQRAALGAGAIVLEALSAEDERSESEIIKQIRYLKPDIFLLTGGTEEGERNFVIEMAEKILAASPKARFGDTLKLPVIYAGNSAALQKVTEVLAPIAEVTQVKNIRPKIDKEDLSEAREAIHDLFMNHVMSHSPGFDKLISWSPHPVIPTPSAVGKIVQSYAASAGKQVLCADIGGATTDIFSVFNSQDQSPQYNRTVSANMGMSYSMANVLLEAGIKNILRWLPFEIEESDLRNRLMNKMIRPTTLPQTKHDLWIEQAICREALRLSLKHHKSLAVGISGRQRQRSIAEIFSQASNREELVNMAALDMVIGSGGVLSHAPHRLESALMVLDGFELTGVTEISVDSIFMMPHLGILSEVDPAASNEIFEHDCLINICVSVVPYSRKAFKQKQLARVLFDGAEVCIIGSGELKVFDQFANREGSIAVEALDKLINIGAGPGVKLEKRVRTGKYGILIDGRNRPVEFNTDRKANAEKQKNIYQSLGIL